MVHVVGARPNFMKAAPLVSELARQAGAFSQVLVHTGQHYDDNMSRLFFDELGLPHPDVNLGVGSGSHAEQTARVMTAFEPLIGQHKPDWVVVYGDVNSTLAAALVSVKLGVRVAHVEAGLRSFDRSMPEEHNRVLTDHLADLLFTPSSDADENLQRENIPADRIRLVGNIMIDTLVRLLPKAEERWPGLRGRFGVERFVLVTLHRPSNVDDPVKLAGIMNALKRIAELAPVIFPMHPRTRARLDGTGKSGRVAITEPLGYLDFLALQKHAALVITDSGGVQEETTFLGVPCITLRPNTERPITITRGTNKLVTGGPEELVGAARHALGQGGGARRPPPPLWDGATAGRIEQALIERACKSSERNSGIHHKGHEGHQGRQKV